MARNNSAAWRDRRGVAALEFALIAPMYLLLMMGVVAYGLYCTVQIAVTAAATEGARAAVGMLGTSTTYSPVNVAKSTACAVLNSYTPLLQCSAGTSAYVTVTQSGTQVTVTVTYPYSGINFVALVPLPLTAPSYTATAQVSAY